MSNAGFSLWFPECYARNFTIHVDFLANFVFVGMTARATHNMSSEEGMWISLGLPNTYGISISEAALTGRILQI